ncbi:hydrogenase expression/formation protein HypE [bacterium]|nr:hydrogenase expression/formation protein HypE [bacterium]
MEQKEKIKLGHGSGGRMSQELFESLFQPLFSNEYLNEAHDGAILKMGDNRIAFSTDSFVVKPLFFPGGNIGDLAVNGTVNDVTMCGADPQFISAGFILEEGFPIVQLQQIVTSMQTAAEKAGVLLVTGDTKVVERGSADGVFINTSGIGVVRRNVSISPKNAREGDVILINGRIAEHGIAVMTKREGMEFESSILSDCMALNKMVGAILDETDDVHVLRDPTRGGIAATLNEIAQSSSKGIDLIENKIPLDDQVKSVSSILGLDPLYIANEGKVLVIVAEKSADKVLETMKQFYEGRESAIIGRITNNHPGRVVMETSIGTKRIVDMPSGEQLPRIC